MKIIPLVLLTLTPFVVTMADELVEITPVANELPAIDLDQVTATKDYPFPSDTATMPNDMPNDPNAGSQQNNGCNTNNGKMNNGNMNNGKPANGNVQPQTNSSSTSQNNAKGMDKKIDKQSAQKGTDKKNEKGAPQTATSQNEVKALDKKTDKQTTQNTPTPAPQAKIDPKAKKTK